MDRLIANNWAKIGKYAQIRRLTYAERVTLETSYRE